jgi:flagellin
MAITFNTNLAALSAQRSMNKTSDMAGASLNKLSSGSRVPTAKDDAAALAIGTKLKSETSSLIQASNNTGQAISMLQVADGALSTISDLLIRMKDLATQSSSGQLGNSERSLLNQEFVNLRTEVDRIAQTTNFNGTLLLQGGDVTMRINDAQNGSLAAKGMALKFDTNVTNASDVFRISYNYTDVAAATGTDTGNMTLTNLTTGASQTVNIFSIIAAKQAQPAAAAGSANFDLSSNLGSGITADVNFSSLGVTVTLDDNFDVNTSLNQVSTPTALGNTLEIAANAGTTSNALILGGSIGAAATTGSAAIRNFKLINTGAAALTYTNLGGDPTISPAPAGSLRASTAYNMNTGNLTLTVNETSGGVGTAKVSFKADGLQFSTDGGVTWTATGAATNDIVSTAVPTPPATASIVNVKARLGAGAGADLFSFDVDTSKIQPKVTTNGTTNMDFNLGNLMFGTSEQTGTATSIGFKVGTGVTINDSITVTIGAVTTAALGIGALAIDSQTNADAAITAISTAVSTVSSRRADIGANQSRMEFAKANLAVAVENTTAATSALLDVDVASEITNFTSKQVLLQAGINMLAQANQQPNYLLKLLQ